MRGKAKQPDELSGCAPPLSVPLFSLNNALVLPLCGKPLLMLYMKKVFLIPFAALAMTAAAQTASDPVLMVVNGKPVTKAEFEYSYNKNGNVEGAVEKKTVKEYVPMFINYKLKVAAAEAAHLDTLSSFKKEFLTYRDMQLTPYMVDQTFIDSIAHVVYDHTAQQLDGKDLLRPAHILIALKQKATEQEKTSAKEKADSIYNALLQGADFAEMAKKFSADPSSAAKGGQLPLIGPGATVKEFEEAAYALQTGETSKPVLSPYGYHIIRMTERKPLDSFETLQPQIITSLKRQNIEEVSAEQRIKRMVDASNGRLTREAVLDSVMNANVSGNANLRYLIQEYHDGLLLYEVSKRQVWDVAAADSVGQEQWYKAHKKQYAWTEPRFKGFVYHSKDEKLAKSLNKYLSKHIDDDAYGSWRADVKKMFNKDSVMVNVNGPYLCVKGENPYIDAYAFGTGKTVKGMNGYKVTNVSGKVLKQPKSWRDVKAQVLSDYQADMEKTWVEQLHQKFTYSVNDSVLDTIQ